MVLGKAKVQYGASTWIIAKRRQAMPVAIVPSAVDAQEGGEQVKKIKRRLANQTHIRDISGEPFRRPVLPQT